jgi:A1 cistron-splicing factor AAR2
MMASGTTPQVQPGRIAMENSTNCLKNGDVIVVTGVPAGIFFGYDTVSFTIDKGGHFHGIREVPSGPHFIYGGSTSEMSTRNGFWMVSKQKRAGEAGEIFHKRWDKSTETLEEETGANTIEEQKQNLPAIYNKLLPYSTKAVNKPEQGTGNTQSHSHHGLKTWNSLTLAITGPLLTRITGQAGNAWQVSSNDEGKQFSRTASKSPPAIENTGTPTFDESIMNNERFLDFLFPRGSRIYSEQVTGRMRTEQAMDSTAFIEGVIKNHSSGGDFDQIIGELQFCYITGIVLGNITLMEQWGHEIKLLLKAFHLAMEQPALFRGIIKSIHAQLMYDEEEVDGSIFDHDEYLQNDVKLALTVFKSRLEEQMSEVGESKTQEHAQLEKAFEELEAWLQKWDWELSGNYLRSGRIQLEDGEYVDAELKEMEDEDERGEYAPVIVEMEEDGREKGMLRW